LYGVPSPGPVPAVDLEAGRGWRPWKYAPNLSLHHTHSLCIWSPLLST
jgi:hypothetical protein